MNITSNSINPPNVLKKTSLKKKKEIKIIDKHNALGILNDAFGKRMLCGSLYKRVSQRSFHTFRIEVLFFFQFLKLIMKIS